MVLNILLSPFTTEERIRFSAFRNYNNKPELFKLCSKHRGKKQNKLQQASSYRKNPVR